MHSLPILLDITPVLLYMQAIEGFRSLKISQLEVTDPSLLSDKAGLTAFLSKVRETFNDDVAKV